MQLKNAKVPAEMHMYAQGGHGYGLRRTAFPITSWPKLVETWLHTIKVLPARVDSTISMLLAVLTISDRCSQGLLADTAGPAVVALLKRHWPEAEIWTGLLPDDEDAIAGKLRDLSGQGAALVLTVGGTGLGPRDRTPEATRRVIDRKRRAWQRQCARWRKEKSIRMAFAGSCRPAAEIH